MPEIGALRELRNFARTVDKSKYPMYRNRENYGIYDSRDWYKAFYKEDVIKGIINTSKMKGIDTTFVSQLERDLTREGSTLANFMGIKNKPSPKVQAMALLLGTTAERAQAFLHSPGGGRPSGVSRKG